MEKSLTGLHLLALSVSCIVTLSPFVAFRVNSAKGLARGAQRCFAALSMTKLGLPTAHWQGERALLVC